MKDDRPPEPLARHLARPAMPKRLALFCALLLVLSTNAFAQNASDTFSDHGPGRVACEIQWTNLHRNDANGYEDFIRNCMKASPQSQPEETEATVRDLASQVDRLQKEAQEAYSRDQDQLWRQKLLQATEIRQRMEALYNRLHGIEEKKSAPSQGPQRAQSEQAEAQVRGMLSKAAEYENLAKESAARGNTREAYSYQQTANKLRWDAHELQKKIEESRLPEQEYWRRKYEEIRPDTDR
jgi:hypothetical protein